MFNHNINKIYYSSSLTQSLNPNAIKIKEAEAVASLDNVPLREKISIENNLKIKAEKKQKHSIPGAKLLKRLHKEQKMKVSESDSDENDDDINKYINSINHVMKKLNIN